MGHAERNSSQDRDYVKTDVEVDDTLSEATVLERLEADVLDDEDRCEVTGIGNGVVIGALVWIFVIGAVVIVLY